MEELFMIKSQRGKLFSVCINKDGNTVTIYNARKLNPQHSKDKGNLVIPELITHEGENYKVTSIGDRAFGGCTELTSITIPNSVTSIGFDAFGGCEGLTSISIPDSVTTIGDWAFEGCKALTSVTIPDSVTSIGEEVFCDCIKLAQINVAADNSNYTSIDGVLYTKDEARLIKCPDGKIGNFTIPNSVTSIGKAAFSGCEALTSVTIGNSVTSIREEAFFGCSGLTSVTIGNSVTRIGKDAFEYCFKLTSIICEAIKPPQIEIGVNPRLGVIIYVPAESLEAYQSAEVWKKYLIQSVDGHKVGGGMVFLVKNEAGQTLRYEVNEDKKTVTVYKDYNNKPEGSLVIPESVTDEGKIYKVTSIGDNAFDSCTGLTSISIPDSVKSIGERAFDLCKGLTSIVIPNSVTSIGRSVFANCKGLTSVTIPNSVKKIKDGTFIYCEGLTSVTIPNSITRIGTSAFYGCKGLTSVTIGDSVTSIGDRAFCGCSGLTSVTIPTSVISIGDNAFGDGIKPTGPANLTSVICQSPIPPKIKNSWKDNVVIYVPAESLKVYQYANEWKKYTIQPME